MMLAVVIASLVALAAAQEPGCCTPNQWEGVEGSTGGYATTERDEKPGFLSGYTFISYDADNQKVAATANSSYNGRWFAVKAIYDFQNQKRYYIYNNTCRSLELKGQFRKACIPSTAKLSPAMYLGAGDNKLSFKVLKYSVEKGTLRAEATAGFAKGCVPLSEEIHGSYKRKGRGRRPILASFVENIGFVGITTGIKDPSVFTPPSICKQDESYVEPDVFGTRKYRFFGGF